MFNAALISQAWFLFQNINLYLTALEVKSTWYLHPFNSMPFFLLLVICFERPITRTVFDFPWRIALSGNDYNGNDDNNDNNKTHTKHTHFLPINQRKFIVIPDCLKFSRILELTLIVYCYLSLQGSSVTWSLFISTFLLWREGKEVSLLINQTVELSKLFTMDSKPVFASMILWLLLSCILTGHPEGFNLKETITSRRKRRSRNKRAQKVSLAALKKMAVFVANSWVCNTLREKKNNDNIIHRPLKHKQCDVVMTSYHIIVPIKFCLDVGNDECIILCNFGGRIMSGF